ncbi:hypothetical protein M0802_016173 [Mischocyttarus mexicanus]|nr:hypothetical protein M0802_016173 [Mischocyttarus mexicanus]
MQEIANQGNIEEDALIQYLADGLLGERRDKAILYGSRTLTEFRISQSDMSYEVLLGRELLKELDIRINKGRVEIRRPDKRLSEEISKGSVRSSDYGHVSGERRTDTNDMNANKEVEDIKAIMEIKYVDTDEIDVKEPYKVRIKELIQNYKPNIKSDARTETKIKLTDNSPVCSKPRRLAPKERKIVTQQLDEWLGEGIIQPSTSEYSSPVVVVPKKDGTYRVCVDYRRLNEKVIRDRFPMPLIEDCLDALTQAVVFSTIDLENGFFHVKIEEDSRKFTSFVTPDGQFEFLRTPFGLCNSPASFLRFIDEVFGDLVRKKIVLTYMDNLIIPGIDYEDACRKLEKTLTVAAQNGLVIN